LDNLTNSIDVLNTCKHSITAKRIAVIGTEGEERNLIGRLLPNHLCSFLKEHQLDIKSQSDPVASFDAIVFIYRRSSNQPIPSHLFSHPKRAIIMSSCVEENTIVQAIYAGADYYFDMNESERVLSSRFSAALRSHNTARSERIVHKPYTFDIATRTIYKDNQKIYLTHREFELALYLFSNQGKLIKDSDLLTWVWGLSPSVGTRRISTTVYQVNKKLRLQSVSARWDLKRFYAQGYRLTDKQHSPIKPAIKKAEPIS